MITLSKNGNAIRFTFVDNGHYLFNGTIDVPINSLLLITDKSEMATFKKSATNDTFISALYSDFGMSKSELETWYMNNMVGSSGSGSGGTTPEEVQQMIDESISGLAESSAVTLEISEAVSGKADSDSLATVATSGSYNDLLDKPTIPDVSNYFDGAEYDSGTTRINFYHGSTVKAYIDASAFIVDGMVDDVRIDEISGVTYLVIDFNTASGKEDIQIPLTDIFDPSNYYTKSEVDDAISAATDDMATQTWVGEQGYLTEHQSLSAYSTTQEVNTAIEESTSGKADTSAVTAVNDALTAHTSDADIHVTVPEKMTWNAKSDFSGSYNDLTDKPTIPTVPTDVSAFNNDAGYITSDSLSGYAESSAVTEEISAAVSGKVDTTTYTAYTAATDTVLSGKLDASAYTPTDLSEYWTSAQTESAINAATSGKADTTAVTTVNDALTAHTSDSDIHVTVPEKVAWNEKQDALVSGTNIKTINNESILGSGNITIQGGGSGSSTVELTQAEYDALVSGGTVDPTTYYIITDATPIDMSNYYTSAQTDSAISAATSGLQETLVSGTNIKTINNESILGSGNITIQGGGGVDSGTVQTMIDESISGKVDTSSVTSSVTSASTDSEIPTAKAVYDAVGQGGGGGTTYSAGTGIKIDSANVISCKLPFNYTRNNGFDIGSDLDNRATLDKRLFIGNYILGGNGGAQGNSVGICYGTSAHKSYIYGNSLVGIGYEITIGTDRYNGVSNSVAIGNGTTAKINNAVAIGYQAVASGTTQTNINNQLKIDTDNQIYIKDKTNTNEICLQDYLGGGGGSSYTAGDGIDITNDVISVTGKVDTSSVVTAVTSASTDSEIPTAKAVYDAVGQGGGGGTTYSAGTDIDITNDVISVKQISGDSAFVDVTSTLENETSVAINASAIIATMKEDAVSNGVSFYDNNGRFLAVENNGSGLDVLGNTSYFNYSTDGYTITASTLASGDTFISISNDNGNQLDSLVEYFAILTTTYSLQDFADNVYGKFSGYVATSAITSAVTSASTDSEIPTAKAVYDATQSGGGGMTEDDELLLATALTDLNDRKIDAFEVKSNYQKKGDYVTTDTLNTRLAEYETALDEQNVEEVTAYALNDLNNKFGGLSLVKITESEYAALTTKNENTLYIVVADPS